MRRPAVVPFLLAVFLVVPLVLAQEKPAEHEGEAGQKLNHGQKKKEHLKIEDAVKRCYTKAKADDDLEIVRTQVLKSRDSEGHEAVVFVVEYKTGEVGILLGSLDPDLDQGPVMIEKRDTEVVQEIFRRADRR